MNTVAAVLLLILGAVVLQQIIRGTLPQWLRAKFLNQGPG